MAFISQDPEKEARKAEKAILVSFFFVWFFPFIETE